MHPSHIVCSAAIYIHGMRMGGKSCWHLHVCAFICIRTSTADIFRKPHAGWIPRPQSFCAFTCRFTTLRCVWCMHMQGLCGTLLWFGVKDEIPGDGPAWQSIFTLTHTHKHRPTLNTKGVWSKQTHTITPSKHTYSHTHSSALPLFSFPSPLLALLLLSLFVLSIVNGDI